MDPGYVYFQWPAFLTARQADAFHAVARMKPGVTVQQAQQEMSSIQARLTEQYPEFEAGKSVNLVPLSQEVVGPRVRASLWMLLGAVLFLLLLACINVASLVLARQSAREKEQAIRLALGASRARLLRLQVIESVVLALWAAVPGLALAGAAILVVRAFVAAGRNPRLCRSSPGSGSGGVLRAAVVDHRHLFRDGTGMAKR